MSNESSNDIRLVLREYIESLFIAILLAVLLRTFVLSAYKIPSESMLPTLRVGDFVFAYKLPYGVDIPIVGKRWWTGHMPERGDIVVFKHPQDKSASFIKRVIGLPGDRIEIKQGLLFVNDQMVPFEKLNGVSLDGVDAPNIEYRAEKFAGKPYSVMVSSEATKEIFGPMLVPPGHFFVLGDNRYSSDDSRHWGVVPMENIEGKAFVIWLSLDWTKRDSGFPAVRWGRLFKTL